MAAVACTYIMAVVLNLYKSTLRLKILYYRLSRLIAVHSCVLRIIVNNLRILCHNIDDRKLMS